MHIFTFKDFSGNRLQLCDRAAMRPIAWQRRHFSPGQALVFLQSLAPQESVRLDHWLERNGTAAHNPKRRLSNLLESGRMQVYQQPASSAVLSTATVEVLIPLETLYSELRRELKLILIQEQQQANQINQGYQQQNSLQKTASHAGAVGEGLLSAGSSLLQWLSDINDVVNPLCQLKRRIDTALEIYEESVAQGQSISLDSQLIQRYLHRANLKDRKELTEALGFDPANVDLDAFSEAWHTAWILAGNEAVVNIISQFAKDYAGAQHSLEISRASGGAVFEILLSIILAAATGGVGLAASLGSKARHVGGFQKVAKLLMTVAQRLEGKTRGVVRKRRQMVRVDKGQANNTQNQKPTQSLSNSNKIESHTNADTNNQSKALAPSKKITSFNEAEARLKSARNKIKQRKIEGKNLYKPKYTDEQLIQMAKSGATAKDRFLVSVQPKNASTDATLSFQRETGLVPTWTTSFDQLEAADSDPHLIHQVLGAESNFDPNKEYVMHIIDRGENFDQFGDNTIVPTWDKLADASVRELTSFDETTIRNVMNENYQSEYASKMQEFKDAGGNEFNPKQINSYAKSMTRNDKDRFLTRHKIRTEIGANAEFTGNGLTANSAPGNSNLGIVETLSLERNLPDLSDLQNDGIVKTIDLKPL